MKFRSHFDPSAICSAWLDCFIMAKRKSGQQSSADAKRQTTLADFASLTPSTRCASPCTAPATLVSSSPEPTEHFSLTSAMFPPANGLESMGMQEAAAKVGSQASLDRSSSFPLNQTDPFKETAEQAYARMDKEVDKLLGFAGDLKENSTSAADDILKGMLEQTSMWPHGDRRTIGDDVDDSIQKAAMTGEFDLRGAIGAKFQRAHKAGSEARKAYDLCKSRDSKAAFRTKWAKETYASYTKEKTYEQSYKTVDTSKGSYKTLGGVVCLFGGWEWKPAVEGALRLASKCSRLGGQWSYLDYMSGLQFFLVMERQWEGIIEEKWGLFEKTYKQGKLQAGATDVQENEGDKTNQEEEVEVDKTNQKEDVARQGPKGKSGAKGKAKAKGKASAYKDDKSPLKDADVNKEAPRVKALLAKHRLAATTLMEKIGKNDDFKWARTSENEGALSMAMKDLDDAMTDFDRDFLVMDAKELKLQAMCESAYNASLQKFCGLHGYVDRLNQITNMILVMHSKRIDMTNRMSAPRA